MRKGRAGARENSYVLNLLEFRWNLRIESQQKKVVFAHMQKYADMQPKCIKTRLNSHKLTRSISKLLN